jgi:hypothetical protein
MIYLLGEYLDKAVYCTTEKRGICKKNAPETERFENQMFR